MEESQPTGAGAGGRWSNGNCVIPAPEGNPEVAQYLIPASGAEARLYKRKERSVFEYIKG